MTDLTRLTLAQARDGLKAKSFTAVELTQAHVDAVAKARALNAYIVETPEKALDMARASDARLAKGEGGALEGLPLGIKDLYCTEGVQTTAASHILEGFAPQYEFHRDHQPVARRRGDAGQTQSRRIRHGLVERDQLLRPGGLALAAPGFRRKALGCENRPRRLLRRFLGGGGCASVPGRHRDRHRRLDPPARRLYRHGRHQAHLWPLLALGYRRLRLLARSGRPDRAHRARRRDHAALHGRPRPEGHHLASTPPCPITSSLSAPP